MLAYPANSRLPAVEIEATNDGRPLLVFKILKAVAPTEVEAMRIVKAEPVVKEVAEMLATLPMVLEEPIANDPEDVEPGKLSTITKAPLGVAVPMPSLLLVESQVSCAEPEAVLESL